MDTSRSASVWWSCPSVLLGKELTLVELIIYPWIDTGVIQSFRIRTKTKKKIWVEMTPLITTKPLAHSNSTTTTVRQQNPTLPPNNLKTDCSCPFHRIYVFSDTSMLVKISQNVYSTITNDHVSLSPKQSQHCVRMGSKERERNERVEKLEMMWSSGLFRHCSCEKKKKKTVVAIQGSPYDGFTYHFYVTIIFTTNLVFFHKRLLRQFDYWLKQPIQVKESFLSMTTQTKKIKQYTISDFVIIYHRTEKRK